LTLFLLLLDYYVIRPILFYYIFDCPNPASGLQYRNKRIIVNNVYVTVLQTVGSKLCSFEQWAAATCAALPNVIAGQYAISNCKPLPVIRCKYACMYVLVYLLLSISQ